MNNRCINLILLLLVVTGCTLSPDGLELTATVEPAPILPTTGLPTVQPTTPVTPTQSQSGLNENLDAEPPAEEVALEVTAVNHQQSVLPDCAIQHPEWPIYIVRAGDTLTSIAAEVGSPVNVLVQVNCLVDANRIYVGQQLHVPLNYVPPQPVEPPPSIPLVDIGLQPSQVCVVVPNAGQANIYGAGVTGGPAAILIGTVHFVRHADNAYIVELPPGGVQGWVSPMEAHLVGSTCPAPPDTGSGANPNIPPDLPVIRNGDAPPGNVCSVVKDPSPGTRYIYGGASSAHAPIAIMGDYLLFLAEVNGGYEVVLPGWDMTGWIPANGVSLSGDSCPEESTTPG